MLKNRTGIHDKQKNRLTDVHGMTVIELIMVVTIIGILAAVAFVAVQSYQRSLGQVERDDIAKEIFVAAQNHLTEAKGQGYLDLENSGLLDEPETFGTQDSEGAYYYVVNEAFPTGTDFPADSVIAQMLPYGAIDESVRGVQKGFRRGSYIVRYQKETGLVLDVFYCSHNDSPSVFNYELENKDYVTVLGLRDTATVNHKQDRRNWDGHILGWYGGEDAASLATTSLLAPKINVRNEERLYVTVTDQNHGNSLASLKLIVTGKSSGAKISFELSATAANTNNRIECETDEGLPNGNYKVILDDITKDGMRFANITADNGGTFIPGENLEIQAVSYTNQALSNIGYSAKVTTNSLFAGIGDEDTNGIHDTAYINNIRHLQNLENVVSHFVPNPTITNGQFEKFNIVNASQNSNMSWTEFQSKIDSAKASEVSVYHDSNGSVNNTSKTVDGTKTGYFYPINNNYSLSYEGNNHSISNIAVDFEGPAGLFGTTASLTAVKNLELIDFSIKGTSSAGALAGSIAFQNSDDIVSNVIARSSSSTTVLNTKIIATASDGYAGGLIGVLSSGKIEYSAASVIVNGATVGGLIGESNSIIKGCYSGGHTKDGSYQEWVGNGTTGNGYDVTGTKSAGGLIGRYFGTSIDDSYSTCSVSSSTTDKTVDGDGVGGLLGKAESGTITNCYATGLIKIDNISTDNDHETNSNKGGFIGLIKTGVTLSGCYYYKIINEVKKAETKNDTIVYTTDHYLEPVGDIIDSLDDLVITIDQNATVYNDFVGAFSVWGPASAYDTTLTNYYNGKYNLKSVLRPEWEVALEGSELTGATSTITPKTGNTGLMKNEALPIAAITDYYVSTHYGDWPSPEAFFINP